jgi:cob(I)alamin adenosyltransferase
MKIYTRTGDDGTTALFSGGRVSKHHLRVEAYGTVDELNSLLGLVRAHQPLDPIDGWLRQVQTQLFYLGADLATPADAKSSHIVRIDPSAITWLEGAIDTMTADLPPLQNIILPGGTLVGAQLHIARTVCRRAERITTLLAEHEDLTPQILPYLNRLSDFLFTLARWENWKAGIADDKWALP